MSRPGLCHRLGRTEGYICPWEPSHAAKMLGFAKLHEVVAATYGEEGPDTFSLPNIAEICSFLNLSPVWQRKLGQLLGTAVL